MVESLQAEGCTKLGGDRLVWIIAGLADVDGHIGALAALEDGDLLGWPELARVVDLDQEILKPPDRCFGELALTPALIGALGSEIE